MEYVCSDILFYIIRFLDLQDILNLSLVNKALYRLCRFNIAWWNKLYDKSGITNQALQIIYDNNKQYFISQYHFQNYINIDYMTHSDDVFFLFGNICDLVSDMRAPYYHQDIVSDIRRLYDKLIIMEEFNYDNEFIYKIIPVNEISNDQSYFWKYQVITSYSECLLIMKYNRDNKIVLKKFIKPLKVPPEVIKKTTIIMYAETIERLFRYKN